MKALQLAAGDRGMSKLMERLLKRVEEQHEQLDDLARELEVEDVVRGLDLSEERTILATIQQRGGDALELQRQRTLGRVLDELYFRVEIEPGVGGLDGTSVFDATNFLYEDLPPAAVTMRRRSRRMRSLWPKVRTRLNLWYTAPKGGPNFSIRYDIRQLAVGMLVTAPAVLFSATLAVPPPTVADTVLFATYLDPTPWLPAPALCEFSVGRIVDGNVNDFRFILAEFVLEEIA